MYYHKFQVQLCYIYIMRLLGCCAHVRGLSGMDKGEISDSQWHCLEECGTTWVMM